MNENNKPQPTEEQVKSANELEAQQWKDDFDPEELKVPYKREEVEEEQPKKTEKKETVVEPEEDYEEPAPVVTVEDPGEYQPQDYSFEVTLKDGKTHKVSTPEEAEKLADDPDNFETPKQLMEFITKSNKMQRNLDRDYEKWDEQKKTFDSQSQEEKARQDNVANLVKGFEYLADKGLIPKLSDEDKAADWSDPEVAKHDGVKEHLELINYMAKENAIRKKAGVPELSSVLDAFNAWSLENVQKQKDDEQRVAGEARRTAGARVAGVSASNQAPYVPKGIAVGDPSKLHRNANMWA